MQRKAFWLNNTVFSYSYILEAFSEMESSICVFKAPLALAASLFWKLLDMEGFYEGGREG